MNTQYTRNRAVGGAVTRRGFLQIAAVGLGTSVLSGQLANAEEAARPGASPVGLPTAVVYDEVSKSHAPAVHEPERPQRYDAVVDALAKSSYFSALKPYQSRSAADEEILACHSKAYVEEVKREIESGAKKLSTGDTWVSRKSFRAAHYACGAGCVAIDAVVGGEVKNAFCVTRPPGHHASADRGMGFCIFNNAAIAARYAQHKHKLGKVLIVDWDVHHGNGTQDIFYRDDSVFYFSIHQSPWYPWTGRREETGSGKGLGTTLNCPVVRGAGRKQFLAAFHDLLAPALNRFQPELVIISAGFDAREGDPLGRLELTDEDYRDLTGLVLEMARQHAKGRVVSILEGGYSLSGLASAAVAHCGRLHQG